VIVGFIFMMYGWDKFFGSGLPFWADLFAAQGIPLATPAATLVGLVELGGGAALILGLCTRIAASLLAIDMAVAVLLVGVDGGFFVWDNGVSFPLALFAAVVALALMGSGEASLGAVLARRLGASL
jgi:putative oxidoreductase